MPGPPRIAALLAAGLLALGAILPAPVRAETTDAPAPPGTPAIAAPGAGSGAGACRRAIAAVEPGSGVPAGMMGAIAMVESGRADPATGRAEAWPWTWNALGVGHYAATKAEAMTAVAALLARGVRVVDVGCMQVNLFHHPAAFADLEAAFDPVTNVRYAARFLLSLRAQTGAWGTAIARYHSGDEFRGWAYERRVALGQLGAAWGRGGAPAALAIAGIGILCASGLSPVAAPRPRIGRGAAVVRITCRPARRR